MKERDPSCKVGDEDSRPLLEMKGVTGVTCHIAYSSYHGVTPPANTSSSGSPPPPTRHVLSNHFYFLLRKTL